MNIDSRYDHCLSDMLTLLQQAVFRFISDLQVDLNKFFLFFKQFHRNLISLEDNFHQGKVKFTKYLTKLYNLTQQVELSSKERLISLEPEKSFYKTMKSKDLKTESVSKMSIPHEKTEELNVIGQIEERQDFDDIRFKVNDKGHGVNQVPHKNRVGTAQNSRHKMSVTIDFHNARPHTGSYKRQTGVSSRINKSIQQGFKMQGNKRYRSLTKYEKMGEEQVQFQKGYIEQPSQPTQKKVFNLNQKKTIYEVLEEQKKSRNEIHQQDEWMKAGLVKIPQKRKKKVWSRWSFKINKLL